MSSYQITDIEIAQSSVDLLRKHVRQHNGHVLAKIDRAVNWNGLIAPIEQTIDDAQELDKSFDLKLVVKSLVLKELYGLGEFPFENEVADRKSFQKFLNLEYGDVVPSNELLDEYHDYLKMAGKYDNMFDRFFKQLIDADVIPENDLFVDEPVVETETITETTNTAKVSDFDVPLLAEDIDTKIDEPKGSVSVEDMIKEIEDRVKNIYEKKSPEEKKILEKTGLAFDKPQETVAKISKPETPKVERKEKVEVKLKEPVKEFAKEVVKEEKKSTIAGRVEQTKKEAEQKSKNIYDKLSSIDDKIKSLNSTTEDTASDLSDVHKELEEQIEKFAKTESKVEETTQQVKQNQDDLYKKLFESFYNQLRENNLISNTTELVIPGLDVPKDAVKEVSRERVTETVIETEKKVEEQRPMISPDFIEEQRTIETTGQTVPVVMRPKKREINLKEKKKYPIFNDANLTEDYELGLRFYKLGFKTSFVNLKTEREHGNTRIATGEYFPNTFWGSVKQRSRWLAGIVFQNWKIHGWGGSMKTKYFLLRDRKSILSFVGTALSYLCLIYFVVYAVTLALGYSSPMLKPIVGTTSPLWYLMLAATFFMVVRIFHRFAFTYNWYGFRYAFFSIFRMLIDNIVNLFAMMRAIKVFRQTKDKVVWDSTEHY